MKMRWVVVVALGSLALGMGGATWYLQNAYSQLLISGAALRTEADIIINIHVLERIRAGKIAEATALLETQLDGDLISAAGFAREGARFHPNLARALALEAKARTLSGYQSASKDVHNAVQEAFCLVSGAAEANPPIDISTACATNKMAPSP